MCGISGIYYLNDKKVNEENFIKLNNTLNHRGPDNGSVKVINNVGLGHRRLSIIDLSDSANQPMTSNDKRYNIIFNGEVYNFLEIKKKLIENGFKFNTTSDTEVVLKAYQFYGNEAFSMFNGMFALAIYDTLGKELTLARDQFGIKPLYLYKDKNVIIFSSEKKAILESNEVNVSLNKEALNEYVWFGNPLGKNTFYKEITEINPGCYIKINKTEFVEKKYFNINKIKEIQINEKEAISKIKELFKASIKRHLISDVPVGVFLSGGIDSSAITAYASKYYKGKLNTYSVGFDYDKGVNELSLAAKVAKKFGTNHTEVQITGDNLIEVIEELVNAHDEPFGDAADIPLYLLTKKIKGKVKVVLQGDGGDEFFGGYSRYNTIKNISKWKKMSFLPKLIKISGTNNTKALRLQRFINAISQKEKYNRNALLLTMESKYTNPKRILNKTIQNDLKNLNPFKKYEEVYKEYSNDLDDSQALFYTDSQIILKDTFFEKVDKSTMANSMEVRVPFIDKNLTEFALSLPTSLKTKNGIQKYLLKKAMEDVVPYEILYGEKKGFSVPYDFWLRTSLKDYFLKQISTKQAGKFINKKEVESMFKLHEKEKGNFGFLLWKTLILCVWLNKNDKI